MNELSDLFLDHGVMKNIATAMSLLSSTIE